MVVVYKAGTISFDDNSLLKTLILPSDADNDEITFHDEVGVDYQVPGGKRFMVGKICWGGLSQIGQVELYIGESAAAEGALTKTLVTIFVPYSVDIGGNYFGTLDTVAVFATGKYVTGGSDRNLYSLLKGTTLYGIEIDV